VDIGVRYLKSWSVPQPLPHEVVTVHPEYFQVYLGLGFNFEGKDLSK
jgi:hypothetical protein